MRKLYFLLAGFFFFLPATRSNANPVSPDVANFTATIDAAGNNVEFVNTSTLGNEPGTRKAFWSFGDGSTVMTPPLLGTQHHYQVAGSYTVCLKIFRYTSNINDSVLSAQVCKTVVIETVCRANFETVATNASLLGKYFVAQPFHNQNKKPLKVCWTFGDGHDTCIQYPGSYTGSYAVYHLYNHPDNYNVCVNIQYDGGCQAQNCHTVQVIGMDSCHADFERISTSTTSNPLHATFKALPSHNYDKKPARICWTFGDGRDTCIQYSNTFPGPYTVNHTYANYGLYEVCVNILYQGGCEARKCEAVRIGRPDTCHANFERLSVVSTLNPLFAYFKALPSHNNDRKPARICWTFGDGRDSCINYTETYSGQYFATHFYNQPGQYEVCVNILYFGGCEARKCNPIQVTRPDTCGANFEQVSVASNALLTYFKAIPSHNNNRKPSKICWTFGDGRDTCINYTETYTGVYAVSHHYDHPGQYEVCVRIIYFGGCEARKCKLISIPPPPVNCSVNIFEITPSITSLVRDFLAVPHTDPIRRPEQICWTFGDGTDTCININPQQPVPDLTIRHTYPAPGVYRACVRIRFQGGCVAESCREVVIRSLNDLCGGYMTDSLVAPRTIKFKGFSIHNPNDEVISYRWTFGDGSTAMGQAVTHTYNVGGEYRVCLTIITRSGCETKICNTVRIPGNNQPALVLSPNPVVNELHVAFLSTHTETVTIKIVNGFGVIVRTYNRSVAVGANNWNEMLTTLMPGVYSYIVQSSSQLASAIFVKL